MTKTFTLLLFFVAYTTLLFSRNSIQLVEINPDAFNNPAAKQNSTDFRFDHKDYIVIQPKNNNASFLSEKGFDVQSYLGNGFYLVSTDVEKTGALLQSLTVERVGYISENSKTDESLTEINSTLPVTVLYAHSVSENAIIEMAQKVGLSIIHNDKKHHHFSVYLNARQLKELAKYPFVYYITKNYPTKNPLIYDGSLIIGANQVQESQPFGFNLKGEGINVGIWDDGAVGTHIDLPATNNFVIDKQNSSLPFMAHPTEVAGCIGGTGNTFALLKGIASKSKMYFWDVLNDIVQEIAEGKSGYAIDISNHSYNFAATNCYQSGLYIPEAADLDKLVYDNPTLLPVVAVGNSASAACAVATDTFSSVDIGFQGCKNALTVGWLFTNEKAVQNSGRGPTQDGRIKPELMAKGFAVQTMLPDNNFGFVYGSSYAAPQVSGLAALLYQKYNQQFSQLPKASLIKAILINTARDLGNPGPDYTHGFGKPDAYRAVSSLDGNLFFENSISQNVFNSHPVTVPSNLSELKITLSWTDKEGSPVAFQSIVNDLDLKLVTPTGDTVLPWKLNAAIPQNNALRGVDNVNTNEQITINNPVPGSYSIVVKGTTVPYGPQDYSVAYYTQDRKIELTHPNGGEVLDATGTYKIRWYANGIDSLAKIEFSSDSGVTWQTVVNNIQLRNQTYEWASPLLASQKCLIRISSGNNVDISESTFTLGNQLNYPLINHSVCDKTVKINWTAFTGASAYKVYLFLDSIWVNVGQTSLLTFTINNLTNGKLYHYSISTINNGFEGNRSLAKSFTPLRNSCTTLNDVGVYAMHQPLGGRKNTSGRLTSATKLSFIIKNYGTATQNSIPVSYRLNGGPVNTVVLNEVITSNDTSIVRFNVSENMDPVGNYNVVAWTSLAGEINTQNDTLYYTIRQLPNLPITLPFSESFETLNNLLTENTFGINGLDYLDYYPEYGGRFRTNEGNLYANTGKRAISLDNFLGTSSKKNELIFTYNLSRYVDSTVYLDFNYMNRSEPDSNDLVFARGDDTKPWIRIYDLFTNRGSSGSYKQASEINLFQKLKLQNGQSFSSSTQIKIIQTGTNTATTPYANGGYSFDDFKLYNAGRDVSVTNAIVKKVNCSGSFATQPITLTVKNNSALPITNLPVSYKIGSNPVVNEFIPFTIAPGDTIQYAFNTLFSNNAPGNYAIKIWASNPGDKYSLNDTFNTSVVVMQTIDSFPYYNDFETNSGNIFSEGVNNSWVWGTPLKYNMNNAAQDNKAWTTGAAKGYNFSENSYLYLGCMDFSSLTTDPLISFNFITIMQPQSDSAYAEYSTNGIDWKRLGCYNCGVNWYNGYLNKPYWDQIVFPWQVAHIQVPLADLADPSNFMYRIHLQSDDFAVTEGIGIDDIRVFDNYEEIATTDSVYVSQTSLGNGWIQFHRNGRLVAEFHDDNKSLGNISLGYEANPVKQKVFNNKNILSRNWVFKPQNELLGNYKVRLYVINEEYTDFVLNEDSINRMGDINLLRYVGLNTNLDIVDNHVKSYYKFYSPGDIQFYPYQNGYFVEFKTDTLGEFFLISSRQDADAIQNINLLDFSSQILNDDVLLNWKTTREVNSKEFVIQYSFDASTFIDVDTVPAGGNSSNTTLYNYLHMLNATAGIYYYRIKMVDNTNKFTYSLIDSVYFAPSVGINQNSIYAKAFISSDDIVVEFKNKLQTLSTVYVYNTLGQLQFSKKMQLQNGMNPLGISQFSNWGTGAYYLHIQAGEHSYYSKLLKQ